MESVGKDVGSKILLNLSYEDMTSLCKIKNNKKIQALCENKDFWRSKIVKDFPLRYSTIQNAFLLKSFKENPKFLYEFINKPSKLWEIGKEDAPSFYEDFPDLVSILEFESRALEILNEELKDYPKTFPVLKGDVLKITGYMAYKNELRYIWDGNKIIPLSYELVEGCAPQSVSFPEFPFQHFAISLEGDNHNGIITTIYLSPNTVNEALKNITSSNSNNIETFITDNYYKYFFTVDVNYSPILLKEEKRLFYIKEGLNQFPIYQLKENYSAYIGNLKWLKFSRRENIY